MLGKAARAVGWALIFVGLVLTARWYIRWADQYLPSEFTYYYSRKFWVYLLSIMTFPTIPLVVLIEWFWHGWPTEISWGFSSWVSGYALLIAGRKRREQKSEDVWIEHE
jgi:hypothetical protein